MRQVLALVAGAAAATLGALVLGEYELVGVVPVVAGVLFGLVVAEVMAAVGDGAAPPMLAGAFAVTAAGLVWGLWISTGRDFNFAAAEGWIGVALGALVAPLWLRSAARRGGRSRPEP